MIKRCLLLAAVVFVSMSAVAEIVSRAEALKTAELFLGCRGLSVDKSDVRKAPGAQQSEAEPYYVFGAEDSNGFVIVSGEDQTPAILGYTDSGSFDEENLPPNFKDWLKYCAIHIEALRKNPSTEKPSWGRMSRQSIAPLLTSRWNQDAPYNAKCPAFFSIADHCVTGCSATAMAQVMYYHRSAGPDAVMAGIPAYDCRRNWNGYGKIHVDAVPAGSLIDWGNITDTYSSASTQVQKDAISSLMFYCGAALNMDYADAGNGGSSAYNKDVPGGLVNYFGYNPRTRYEMRDGYLLDDWYELIYDELKNNGPVFYTGQTSANSGHAFVADGYSADDNLFHINWGWGGYCDGYFVLAFCNPGGEGIGAGVVADGYRLMQSALIDAHPATQDDLNKPVSLTINCSLNGSEITIYFVNNYGVNGCFDGGIGFIGEDGSLSVTGLLSNLSQDPGYYCGTKYTVTLPDGVDELRIVPVSRAHGTEEWQNPWPESCYILARRNSDSSVSLTMMPQTRVEVKSFELGQVRRAGLPLIMHGEFSNPGDYSYDGTVYLLSRIDDGEFTVEDELSIVVMAGESTSFEKIIRPYEAGKYTYVLSTTEDYSGAFAYREVEILEAADALDEQPVEIVSISVDGGDLVEMYEDEDEKGVVIPLSGNAIEGESTLRLNKALTNLTMVMVHLYKYNAATKSYEKYDTYNRYIAFTGKTGDTFSNEFSFTDLENGKYQLVQLVGPHNQYGNIPSPIARLREYRFAVGDVQSGIDSVAAADESAGDNIIYGVDGRIVRVCVSAEEVQDALRDLSRGLYIVNGRKVAVK